MIYIEELLLINFVVDYYILITLSKLLNKNINKKNIVFACLIGEISILFVMCNFNYLYNLTIKIILSLLMCYISFKYIDFITLIKDSIYFNVVCYILGGFIYYLKELNIINNKYYFIFLPVLMNIFLYFTYDLKKNLCTKYKVNIYLNNGEILYLDGYMDSANNLIEPYSNKKVIIIDKYVDENFYLVPYKTIDSECLLKCFNPKMVYIDKIGKRNDISVGVINKKFKGYNCLLNYKLLEDI